MDQQAIGAFIAQARKERGLSQAELGERLGVTNKTVSRWENGNYMPDLALLQPLCRELNIGVQEFLSGRRLGAADLPAAADQNVLSALRGQRAVRRTAVILAGVVIVHAGWVLRWVVDRRIFGE